MAAELKAKRGETAAHARLKRLAMIWAQARGYSICAVEVCLPKCRYRADIAAFGRYRDGDRAAVFECKQARSDLQRDNCNSMTAAAQVAALQRRAHTIERNLRVHYPTLRTGESLFPDFDPFDFSRLHHLSHTRVTRQEAALQERLLAHTKFEKLSRYGCANLFYLVMPEALSGSERPSGWGLLVECGDRLELRTKPCWHELSPQNQTCFFDRVATAATRALNRELQITRDSITLERRSLC
ncbi:MAG: hypothetical protein ABI839_03720 [Verrucomicrobiota bacterium]